MHRYCLTLLLFLSCQCCGWRSYEYLLPLSILAPQGHIDTSAKSPFDAEKLQAILTQFEGTNSFHNFNTEKAEKNKNWGKLKGKWAGSKNVRGVVDTDDIAGGEDDRDCNNVDRHAKAETSCSPPQLKAASSTMYSVRVLPGLVRACPQSGGSFGGGDLHGPVQIPSHQFFTGEGAFDPVVLSGADEPAGELLEDSAFVRIRIAGKFFLYKQIRIMIGTAVAIYSGMLPNNAIATALKFRGHKLTLPVAPAEGLMCVDAGFDRNKGGKNFITNYEMYAAEASIFPSNTGNVGSLTLSSEDAKLTSDMYFPLLEQDGFVKSDQFKFQAIYRTVMALFTPDVAGRWLSSMAGNFSPSSDALRALQAAAEEELTRDDEGYEAFKLRRHEEDWHSVVWNVGKFRAKYVENEGGCDASGVFSESTTGRLDGDISSPGELRSVKYYTRLRSSSSSGTHRSGTVDYHPYRLFLPRAMATELVSK